MTAPPITVAPTVAPQSPSLSTDMALVTPSPAMAPATTKQRSWLTYEHPFYYAHKGRWKYALDHYTGEALDDANIGKYLLKRSVGETDEAYKERSAIADYTNHFAQVVESLAGMLTAVEGDANRIFTNDEGVGLGDVTDPATPIGRLWRRADPEGNGYLTVWKRLAIDLTITHMAWIMVDTLNGVPVVRQLSALAVPNWFTGPDGPECVVIEEVDARENMRDVPQWALRYVHMTVNGWQRYRLGVDGVEVALNGPTDSGTWYYESPEGVRELPIFPVRLPMKRPIGYLMARKANAIFNLESGRDNLLRTANFPRLVLASSNELYDALVDGLRIGSNALQEDPAGAGNGHRYITPPTDAATVATNVLERKVKEFHETAHKAYDDSVQRKTATQVNQEVAAGTGAFLTLLKSALDDAENQALWRIEQAEAPTDRRRWFIAHVERSDDFMPQDPDTVIEKAAAIAFGKDKSVPLGKCGMVEVAKQIAAYRGITVDEDEIESAVRVRAIIDVLEAAPLTGIEIPADVRADLTMALLAAAGFIDAEAVEEMEDGEAVKRADVIRAQIVALGMASDNRKLRESETITPGKGGPDQTDPAAGDPTASYDPKITG